MAAPESGGSNGGWSGMAKGFRQPAALLLLTSAAASSVMVLVWKPRNRASPREMFDRVTVVRTRKLSWMTTLLTSVVPTSLFRTEFNQAAESAVATALAL